MGNARMHISPLASEGILNGASADIIREAGAAERYLRQFRPSVMLAENNRCMYGLVADQQAVLPESYNTTNQRTDSKAGRGVARAISSVQLAHSRIRPFEHGEQINNTGDGALTQLPAFHIGAVSTVGFQVFPKSSRTPREYTVRGGEVWCYNWSETFDVNDESTWYFVTEVAGATVSSTSTDGVIYLRLEVAYGVADKAFADMTADERRQIRVLGSSIESANGTYSDAPPALPRQVADQGYPDSGIWYAPIAFVSGPEIYQDETAQIVFIQHVESVINFSN